jgi:serine/threonine-protein kinase
MGAGEGLVSTDSKSDLPRNPAREPGAAPVYDDATQRTGVPVPSLNAEVARRETPPDGSSASSAAAMGLVEQATVISKRPTSGGESSSTKPPLPAASPAELGKALEGTTLGSFQLQEFVGGGGMGAVFRALDTMLGRTVAVKVLFRDRTDLETLRRFQNEGQSAAQLDHQNIARVYHVGQDKGLHYIVFEFIEGINLRDLVQQHGPLPVAEAVGYTLQVAEALEHAAARGVVHRDIKPSNVLVTADGRAKLVDMGLARLQKIEAVAEDLTASGVTLGTFDYISPEQARDPRVADVRSDLYSLGCTLYFMLTGRPPFPEGTVLQKLLSHSGEEPVDPRQFRPELDEGLVAILRKLLAKQPSRRHQQPNELIGELLLLAERLDLSGVSRIGTYWIASRRNVWDTLERQLPWVLPVAALLAVILVLLARPARDGARPPAPPRLQVQSSAPQGPRQTPTMPPESKPDAAQPGTEASPVPPAAELPRPAAGPVEMPPATPPSRPAPEPVAPGPTPAADPKADAPADGKTGAQTDGKTDAKSDAATGGKPDAKTAIPKPGTPPAELPGATSERAALKPQPASRPGEATAAPGAPLATALR